MASTAEARLSDRDPRSLAVKTEAPLPDSTGFFWLSVCRTSGFRGLGSGRLEEVDDPLLVFGENIGFGAWSSYCYSVAVSS
jgi:hypothetical protein